MTIHITDEQGTVHVYTPPDPDDVSTRTSIAIEDAFTGVDGDDPLAVAAAMQRAVAAYIGAPIELVQRVRIKDLGDLSDRVTKIVTEARELRKDSALVPEEVEWGGKTWPVPKDPASQMIVGQYADIQAHLGRVDYEYQGISVVLAGMWREGGGPYKGAGFEDRVKMWDDTPARITIPVAAFFFAGCEPLSELWSHFIRHRMRSKLQAVQQGLTAMQSGTAYSG